MANFFTGIPGLLSAAFRRPRAPAPTKKVGVSGTAIFGGYIQHVEKDPKLVGMERYRTFSEILANITIVAAGVRYFLNLIGKPTWTAEPVDQSPAAIDAAEFVDDVLADMQTPWPRVVRRAGMYRFHGFSIQEWTAKKRDDGRIGFLDVEPRPQKTIMQWDRDEHGVIRGMVQEDPESSQRLYLPRGKMLYIVDDSLDDSPEGLGLFRHAAETANRLKRLQNLETMGYDTDLRGIPVARAPLSAMADSGIPDEKQQEALQPLREAIENQVKTYSKGYLLDSITYQTDDEKQSPSQIRQWDLDVIKGGSTGLADVGKAIVRQNLELARLLGVEHLLIGGDARGSQALSRDKSHNFGLIVDSSAQEVAWSVTNDLVVPLFRLNAIPLELVPRLKVEQIQYRDIKEVTEALSNMASAGALIEPDDPVVGQVRDIMGLPRPDPISLADDASLMPDESREPDTVPEPEPEPGKTGEDVPEPEPEEEK